MAIGTAHNALHNAYEDLKMENIHPEIIKKIDTDEEFLDTDTY